MHGLDLTPAPWGLIPSSVPYSCRLEAISEYQRNKVNRWRLRYGTLATAGSIRPSLDHRDLVRLFVMPDFVHQLANHQQPTTTGSFQVFWRQWIQYIIDRKTTPLIADHTLKLLIGNTADHFDPTTREGHIDSDAVPQLRQMNHRRIHATLN